MEWFAIVDNSTKNNISYYAIDIQSGITYFTPSGSSTPIPFNNIITTLVTYMQNMLYNTSFNQNIGAWDVSKVTSMTYMFNNASAFNQNKVSLWAFILLYYFSKFFPNLVNLMCS